MNRLRRPPGPKPPAAGTSAGAGAAAADSTGATASSATAAAVQSTAAPSTAWAATPIDSVGAVRGAAGTSTANAEHTVASAESEPFYFTEDVCHCCCSARSVFDSDRPFLLLSLSLSLCRTSIGPSPSPSRSCTPAIPCIWRTSTRTRTHTCAGSWVTVRSDLAT